MIDKTTSHRDSVIEKKELSGIYKFLNYAVPVLMGIYVFFVSIPHSTAVKEISFYLALSATLVLIASKKVSFSFDSPLTKPFVLFAAWALIGLPFAMYKWNSIHDFIFLFVKYLALYYILINFFQSRGRIVILSWIIVASLAVFSFGGMLYYYGYQGHKFLSDRIDFLEMEINIIGYPALFAILLAIALLPIARRKTAQVALLVSMAGTSVMVLLTRSRGTLLGLVLSMMVLFSKRKVLVSLVSLFLVSLMLILPVKSRLTPDAIITKLRTEERIGIWRTYLEVVKDHPVMGIGFGMEMWKDRAFWDKYSSRLPLEKRFFVYAIPDPRLPPEKIFPTHDPANLLVSNLTRLGVVGLILWLYVIIAFVKMGWRVVKTARDDFIKDFGICLSAAFVAYFVKGMFEPALSHVPAIVSYEIFSMMTILWRMQNEDMSPGGVDTVPTS